MAHQCMPKIFHDPHKKTPAHPPTYLMYGPLSLCKSAKQDITRQHLPVANSYFIPMFFSGNKILKIFIFRFQT